MTRRGVPVVSGILLAVGLSWGLGWTTDLPRPIALRGTLAADGESVSVRITVANPASHPTPSASLEVYLSSDGLIDSADLRLAARPLGGLAPGGRVDLELQTELPPQPPGQYFLVSRVVARNGEAAQPTVRDALWGVPLAIGPDLTIAEPQATMDRESVRVTGTAGNRGTHRAAGVMVSVRLVPRQGGDAGGGSDPVALADLAPGESASFDVVVDTTGLPEGDYDVRVEIDPDQLVPEADEGNNQARLEAPYQVGPDLIVIDLSARQDGDAIVVRDVVGNRGNRTAERCGLLFFLSRNGVWDAADVALGYRLVPALDPAGESRGETRLPLPRRGLPAARYFLIAKLDASDAVPETDESNNLTLAPSPIDVRPPR